MIGENVYLNIIVRYETKKRGNVLIEVISRGLFFSFFSFLKKN